MTTSLPTKKHALERAVEYARQSMQRCALCPRRCGINRLAGKRGYCRAGADAVVYSAFAHHGEEPPISGTHGSGTIFFSHCTMRCAYCQNHYFSQQAAGTPVSVAELARMMLTLQAKGCHNINLVSPTHFLLSALQALNDATTQGLKIPIVYNCSGYELTETIRALDGVIDIYLPDMRYATNDAALRYSDAPHYVEHNRTAVSEMHRQVGELMCDKTGIAQQGLIIRLLVLPHNLGATTQSLAFIRDHVSPRTHLSIMSQYYPTFKAVSLPELARGVLPEEYQIVVDEANRLGLNNGWIQDAPDPSQEPFKGTNFPQVFPDAEEE